MKAIKFLQSNVDIAKDQPEAWCLSKYFILPAYVDSQDPYGMTTFCWKLSWKERLQLLFNGVLWHQVLTFRKPLQPQKLMVKNPLEEIKENKLWPGDTQMTIV